jgi:hypothetical protein
VGSAVEVARVLFEGVGLLPASSLTASPGRLVMAEDVESRSLSMEDDSRCVLDHKKWQPEAATQKKTLVFDGKREKCQSWFTCCEFQFFSQ